MGEVMDTTQQRVRASIREAIEKYRSGTTTLNDLVGSLMPMLEELQPEEVWDQAYELYSELDTYYGLLATGEAVQQHGRDFPLTADQRAEVDRMLEGIEQLLA